jgi:ubiquinone/menaquinone biosynthesis C-methylase UbiE
MPVHSAEFNSVLWDNVIEHIEKPDKLLKEIHRVLETGGILLVGIPGELGYRSDPDHKHFYNEEELTKLLETSGFKSVSSAHFPLWKSLFFSKNIKQYSIFITFVKVDL